MHHPTFRKLTACAAITLMGTMAPLHADPAGQEGESPESNPRPKVAWLGLSARAIKPVESTQLGLPPGFGLVVEYVFRDGPASQSGIREHDILRKFDDQLLINPAQLKTLVCSKNKGDLIRLTLLRSGEEIELEVELGEHQIPAVAFRMFRPADGGEPFPVPADASEEVPVRNLGDLLEGKSSAMPGLHVKSLDYENSAASLSDASGVYTLTRRGKSATLTVTRDGKAVFEGPASTDEDRKALPKAIRTKLETLEAIIGKAKTLSGEEPLHAEEIKK